MALDLDLRTWQILICPECGHQSTHDRDWLGDEPIYCLEHEDESGRTERPAHVLVDVVKRSDLEEIDGALNAVSHRLGVSVAEVERLRGLLKEAWDIADGLHWPEGPLAEDGIGRDLDRIRREGGLTDPADRNIPDE